jgi:5,10-methylenetetrahydromethanopterin reductase
VPGVRLGVQVRVPPGGSGNVVDDLVAFAERVRSAGLASLWLPQAFEHDALTALALVGRAVPDLELGTGVVVTYPRHPLALAQQALTVQAATGGRLVLGIGPSHQPVVEGVFGEVWDPPAAHVAEYLDVLLPLLDRGEVDVRGRRWSATTLSPVGAQGGGRCPVLLGAMGPRMLALAGATADGTVTAKVGPRALRDHVVPRLRAAAEGAGRPAPRVVAILSACVTDDEAAAAAVLDAESAPTAGYASYRAMRELDGVERTSQVALIGGDEAVAAKVAALFEAGATDVVARPFGTVAEQERTVAALGRLARSI